MEISRKLAIKKWDEQFDKSIDATDFAGRKIQKGAFGQLTSTYGWTLTYLLPRSVGGTEEPENLICVHVKTALEKEQKFPSFNANDVKYKLTNDGGVWKIIASNDDDAIAEQKAKEEKAMALWAATFGDVDVATDFAGRTVRRDSYGSGREGAWKVAPYVETKPTENKNAYIASTFTIAEALGKTAFRSNGKFFTLIKENGVYTFIDAEQKVVTDKKADTDSEMTFDIVDISVDDSEETISDNVAETEVEVEDETVDTEVEAETEDETVDNDTEVEIEDETVDNDTEVEVEDETVDNDTEVETEDETVDNDTEVETEDETVDADAEVEIEDETVDADTDVETEDETVDTEAEAETEDETVDTDAEAEVEDETVDNDTAVEVEDETVDTDTEVETENETIDNEVEAETEDETVDTEVEAETEDETVDNDTEVETENETVDTDTEAETEDETADTDTEAETEDETADTEIETETEDKPKAEPMEEKKKPNAPSKTLADPDYVSEQLDKIIAHYNTPSASDTWLDFIVIHTLFPEGSLPETAAALTESLSLIIKEAAGDFLTHDVSELTDGSGSRNTVLTYRFVTPTTKDMERLFNTCMLLNTYAPLLLKKFGLRMFKIYNFASAFDTSGISYPSLSLAETSESFKTFMTSVFGNTEFYEGEAPMTLYVSDTVIHNVQSLREIHAEDTVYRTDARLVEHNYVFGEMKAKLDALNSI